MEIVLAIIAGLQLLTFIYVISIYIELKDHRKEMEYERFKKQG